MTKVELTDERIVMEKRKINAATSAIFTLGIVGDIIYKIFTKQALHSFVFEIIIGLLAGLFITVEGTRKGVLYIASNKKEEKRLSYKFLITNALSGLVFVGIDLYIGQVKTGTDIIYLAIGIAVYTLIGYFIDLFVMKRSNRNH
ncbi:MAG: DUF6773 family protein [Sporolactobacillus sp.]